MRTQKCTAYLKIGLFLFGFSVLLWSCEKVDHNSEIPEVQEHRVNPIIKTLNLEKAKEIPDFIEISNTFKTSYLFDRDRKKDDVHLKSKQVDDFTIDFNEFKRIEIDDLVSYTFLISRENNTEKYLTENLVIEKRGSNIRGYIMKYRESSSYIIGNNKYLRANVSKSPYKENLEELLNKTNTNLLARTTCKYEMIVTPRDCTYHGTFSTNHACWNNRDNNYYDVRVALVCVDGGAGGSGDYIDFGETDDPSSGGGGGSSSGGGATSPIIPCEDEIHGCDKIPYFKLANELGITDQNQIDFLEDNPIIVDRINIFLDNNDSVEAENRAKEIIDAGEKEILISAFPFVKYPPNSNYATLYPKLTEY